MPNELARSMPIDAIEAWSYGENKLRILMVISSPLDETIRLNTKHEIEGIYRQLSYSKVPAALIRLNPPTWQCLHTTLNRRHFDIVHFIGYARKDAIQLEKENGSADWVSADHLTDLFRNTGIKLVVINNCSTESLGDSLMAMNVPAVIVTSRKTQSDLAISPSGALYASIASGNSPEQAVKTINYMLRRQRSDREETFTAALRSGADQPLLERDLGSGNTDFFSCYPPNNLPPTSQETIVDRSPDLLKLYKLLDRSTSPFIGIVGLAGSGKSTVAITAAWRYRWRFDRGIAYASLRNMRPFNLTHLLAHLEWGLEEIPTNKQRSVALHELAQGPILLVLDDLENAQLEECRDIIDFLSSWDTSLGGRAILVMRRQRPEFDSLVQSNWLRIGQLPESAALDLFSDLMGGSETAQAKLRSNLPKIPDLCYCHPKLLTLTAAALQMEIPWKQLALQLRRLMGKPLEQMTQVLELTCDQVAKESRIAGQFLDCWPVFAEAATEEAWRFVLTGKQLDSNEPTWHEQNDALTILQRADILYRFSQSHEDHCRIHPLVSEYLQGRWNELSPKKRSEYRRRHLEFYLTAIESKGASFPIIEEWGNILIALERASKACEWRWVLDLCIVLIGPDHAPLLAKSLWNHAKQVLVFASRAAQELSEPRWQATFLLNLGTSQYGLAEYQEAQQSFEHCLILSQRLHDTDLITDAIWNLGRVNYRLVRYTAAKECYEKVWKDSEAKGDLKRTASALHGLGKIAYRSKDIQRAERLFRAALSIRESQNDKKGMGSTLHEIGRTFHETKRTEEALAFYQRSLALRRERGDLTGLQATLHQLGLLAFDQGDFETAKQYYGESAELSNSLNDRFWIAHNKFRYGRLLWRLGEQDKACSHAQESLRVCNLLGIALKKEVEDWLRSPS
jgi:tetratricopeptide (TPR) repeat protein